MINQSYFIADFIRRRMCCLVYPDKFKLFLSDTTSELLFYLAFSIEYLSSPQSWVEQFWKKSSVLSFKKFFFLRPCLRIIIK